MSTAAQRSIIDGDGHVVEDIASIVKYMPEEYIGRSFSEARGKNPFPPIDHLHSANRHFTPKGASWLNMIEAWFGILTRKSVRRGSFDTVRALIRHIEAYIAHWNAHPTPFVWTKTPADIIAKAVRRGR